MSLHRLRSIVLLLVLVAGLPGTLFAGCGAACPPAAQRAAMPCCHPAAVPSVRIASCCETVQAAAPTEAAPAVAPPSATGLAPVAVPLALPADPLIERPTPEPSAGPPPIHEGIGLYTLHSVFLI